MTLPGMILRNHMKNKLKYGVPALALGLMLSGSVAFAQDTSAGAAAGSTTSITVAQPTKKECLANAKTVRVAADTAARAQSKADKKTALDTEKAAILVAKANTDKVAGAVAKKAALSTYKKSIKDIAASQSSALKVSLQTYLTVRKACK